MCQLVKSIFYDGIIVALWGNLVSPLLELIVKKRAFAKVLTMNKGRKSFPKSVAYSFPHVFVFSRRIYEEFLILLFMISSADGNFVSECREISYSRIIRPLSKNVSFYPSSFIKKK